MAVLLLKIYKILFLSGDMIEPTLRTVFHKCSLIDSLLMLTFFSQRHLCVYRIIESNKEKLEGSISQPGHKSREREMLFTQLSHVWANDRYDERQFF